MPPPILRRPLPAPSGTALCRCPHSLLSSAGPNSSTPFLRHPRSQSLPPAALQPLHWRPCHTSATPPCPPPPRLLWCPDLSSGTPPLLSSPPSNPLLFLPGGPTPLRVLHLSLAPLPSADAPSPSPPIPSNPSPTAPRPLLWRPHCLSSALPSSDVLFPSSSCFAHGPLRWHILPSLGAPATQPLPLLCALPLLCPLPPPLLSSAPSSPPSPLPAFRPSSPPSSPILYPFPDDARPLLGRPIPPPAHHTSSSTPTQRIPTTPPPHPSFCAALRRHPVISSTAPLLQAPALSSTVIPPPPPALWCHNPSTSATALHRHPLSSDALAPPSSDALAPPPLRRHPATLPINPAFRQTPTDLPRQRHPPLPSAPSQDAIPSSPPLPSSHSFGDSAPTAPPPLSPAPAVPPPSLLRCPTPPTPPPSPPSPQHPPPASLLSPALSSALTPLRRCPFLLHLHPSSSAPPPAPHSSFDAALRPRAHSLSSPPTAPSPPPLPPPTFDGAGTSPLVSLPYAGAPVLPLPSCHPLQHPSSAPIP